MTRPSFDPAARLRRALPLAMSVSALLWMAMIAGVNQVTRML